jgi:putative membrane protein
MERNHYDRAIHFLFGLLLSYPIHELALHGLRISERWSYLASLAFILACSNVYEIIEWAAAEIIDPEAALAFLGTQGDVFDAQKDAALALAGAVLGLSLTALGGKIRSRIH